VTDALLADGQRVGRARVVRSLKQRSRRHAAAAALLHTVRQDVLGSGAVLQDDVTMVLVQRDLAAGGWRRIELPVSLDALRPLRAFLKDSLSDCGLDSEACSLLQVACAEVFTNIVRHASGLVDGAPVELRAQAAQGLLTIEVVHLGDPYEPPREIPRTDFGTFPEGGMGLEIIHGASDEVRYLHDAGVNTVRMRRSLA
jgi:anti-sigma regulatory factor (Ser/Thr protein kinase)